MIHASSIIVGIIIPVIGMYIALLIFIFEISHVIAENAPEPPNTKKKK